jgi:hypothetical protein
MQGQQFEDAFNAEIRLFKNASRGVSIDNVIASMILKKGDAIDLQLRDQLLCGELRAIGEYDDDVDTPQDVILVEME